jgi:hypothetical protein
MPVFGQPQTLEQRMKAQATRAAKKEKFKEQNPFTEKDCERARYWDIAAQACGIVRLPDWTEPMTTTRMTQWMNRLGINRSHVAVYLSNDEALNSVDPEPKFSPSKFIQDNPRWGLRAFVGTIIENVGGAWIDSKTFVPNGMIRVGDATK